MQVRTGRQYRVLMLGWEYPPRMAGGLGKACQGLSQAMAKRGSQVFFVLPTFPERVTEPRLEVVGAREVLIEAGMDVDREEILRSMPASATRIGVSETLVGEGSVFTIRADAQLFPYGANPSGPAPESIRQMIQKIIAPGADREWDTAPEVHGGGMKSKQPKGRKVERQAEPARHASPKEDGADRSGARPAGAKEIYGKNLWSEIERFALTVRHLADAHEVDVVHAHDWMTFPAAFEFQRLTGVPVFLHVHATEYDRSGENLNNEVFRIEREGFRRATHIFAVSRYTAGIIERLYGVPKRKISVIYNAPDFDSPELLAPPEGDSEGKERKPQVVFLGRLTFQKGPDHFLRAAALVAKANKDARFIICGTGDMMDKLRQEAHQLGIERRVHFAGFVDPSGVDQILMESKVLVMPSVSEPFGLVALEAIRCGIPVILSKQSGVREVLHRALQVDFWDIEKLADQILASLRLPDLTRQLVWEGLDQMQTLSWDRSAEKVIHSYHRNLGSTYAQAIGGGHGH